MADPLKVKAGDMLKIPVEVTYADNARGAPVRVVGGLMPTLVDGGEEFWLSWELVEAAEHIPAPSIRDDLEAMEAIQTLIDAGYSPDDVVQALREISNGA